METALLTLFLSGALTLVFSILQVRIGLNLSDEGFLWYGGLRTAAGDVPKRDFMAYDPFRYYWLTACSRIFGLGILGIRRSTDLFQMLGLWTGLLVLMPIVDNWLILASLGAMMILWMEPRHKRFEHATAIFAVAMALLLLSIPVMPVYCLAGFGTGLAAYMGRNHGVYWLAALTLTMVFIYLRLDGQQPLLHYGVFWAGILGGYSPMWLRWIFVRGEFRAYWHEVVTALLRRGNTNLPLPVPWPWRMKYAGRKLSDVLPDVVFGVSFAAIPLFYIGSIAFCFLTPTPAQWLPLFAASVVGIVYMHHAFARADPAHLSQSIHPFLIGISAVVLNLGSNLLALGFVLLSLLITVIALWNYSPLVSFVRSRSQFTPFDVNGEMLLLPRPLANYLTQIVAFADTNIGLDEQMLIGPNRDTFYPLLGRECPIYNTFMVFEEFPENQEKIIDDLSKGAVAWALLIDQAQDGRDDLRFRNTHPLVWEYITRDFEPVHAPAVPNNHTFFRRKAA